MICNKCNFNSALYLSVCPECDVALIPFELKKYLKFNDVLEKIEENNLLNEIMRIEFVHKIFKDNSNKVETFDTFKFIVTYIKFYHANYLCDILSLYFQNFKKLLKIDYLYYLRPYLVKVALPTIANRIDSFKRLREKYSKINDIFERFTTEESYFFIRTILKHFSIKAIFNKETQSEHIFIYNIILDALTELFNELKGQDSKNGDIDEALIVKLKAFLYEFSINTDENYKLYPRQFQELVNSKEFPNVLLDFDLDFVFLPKHDKYALVKKAFSPNTAKIEKMNEEMEGISLKDLANAFKITLIEAEIIVQVLLRRRLGVRTSSYLRGERFFII